MGNRTDIESFPPVINPPENPFLHRAPDGNGNTRYVPQLSGVRLTLGKITRDTLPPQYESRGDLDIPLLPQGDVSGTQPVINTRVHVTERIAEHKDEIVGRIRKFGADIVVLHHGSGWGLLPEREVASMLEERGYAVDRVYPKVGGRKRYQSHAVRLRKSI